MNHKKTIVFIFIVTSVLFYLTNLVIPFYSDDIGFLFKSDTELIKSIGDLIKTVQSEYFFLHGRIIANFLSHFIVCMLGETGFNIVNTIVFIGLIGLTVKYLKIPINSILSIVVIILGYFLISDTYRQLFVWGVGAGNYLWPLFLLMVCLVVQEYFGHLKNRLLKVLLLLFVAFVSISNEAFLLPICIGYFIYFIVLVFLSKKKPDSSEILFFAAFVVATAILMFSPGTLHRAANAHTTINTLEVIKRVLGIGFSLRIFYIVLWLLLYKLIRNKREALDFIKEHQFIIIMIFAGMVPALLSGGKGRVLITTEVFSLFLLARYLLLYSNRKGYWAAVALFCIMSLYQTLVVYDNSKLWTAYNQTVEDYLKAEAASGQVFFDDAYQPFQITAYSRLSINEILETYLTVGRLQKLKSILHNGEKSQPLRIFPLSVKKELENNLFTTKNVVPGNTHIYTTSKIDYYVLPYDEQIWNCLINGGFTKKTSCAVWNRLHLDIVFDKETMSIGACPAAILERKDEDRVIIVNKRYKEYPLFRVQEINLCESFSNKKFNVYIQ